jgi:hypothetical protein
MIDGKPLTEEQAYEIWAILERLAGADEGARSSFVHHQTVEGCTEFRFQGWLGFGGKFWNANGRWYVTVYPEDMTPQREQVIGVTNAALAGLRAAYEALGHALEESP